MGTPHKGSPLASAYSLVNEEAKKIDERIEVDSKYAENVLGYLYSEQHEAYQVLLANMRANSSCDRSLINWVKKILCINPDDVALKQLRVPADISSQITITDGRTVSLATETITVGHKADGDNKNGQSDTKIVTYDGLAALATPEHFSTLEGTGGTIVGKLAKIVSGLQLSRTYSGFPSGNALSDLATGDGVVTQYSQTALSGSSNTISKYVWHLSEPNEKQAILNALDDSPVIENMRAISANKYANGPGYFVYVITRVKEYLLADIEISSMTVDGNSVDLSEFNDNGHYKPYKKFSKNFLKERPDSIVLDKDGNVVTLKPGEFYVRLYLEGDDPHVVNIDLKNPSDNPHAMASLTIQRPIITNENPTGVITNTRPAIEAQIQSPIGIDIYSSSLVMKVNGSVVSHATSGSDSSINIRYTPNDDLDDGQYTVTVDGKDINGIPAKRKEWTFTIQTQRPIIANENPKGDIISNRPTISARIYSPAGTSINLSSLNMKLDGYTVSHSTSGSGPDVTISYTPPSDLTSTTHTVHLYGQDINGLSASKTWTFVIKPGYFIVEIPAKISIDQDFTMKVTACNGLGQAMDGQGGRELYDENADITISGDPVPQGSLTFTHINSGGWINGVWEATNQKYSNSTEEEYKLTITVMDSGGNYAGMTGLTDTIVGPLELAWYTQGYFQLSGDGTFWTFHDWPPTNLREMTFYGHLYACNGMFRYWGQGWEIFSEWLYAYRIDIPEAAEINHVKVKICVDTASSFTVLNHTVQFLAGLAFGGPPKYYPSSIGKAIFRVDTHSIPLAQTQSFRGNKIFSFNLTPTETFDGGLGIQTIKGIKTETQKIVYEFDVPVKNRENIWLTLYVDNIQDIFDKYRTEAQGACGLQDPTWGNAFQVDVYAKFNVIDVIGYK